MSRVRGAAHAGRFYPAAARALRRAVRSHLGAEVAADAAAVPKALVVPHAGYEYSGHTAGQAYRRLRPGRDRLRRVVLLGPAHHVPVHGVAACSAQAFATPLGAVPVDTDAVAALLALPDVDIQDEAHGPEHSLEVQLPFLQVVLASFVIVPLLVGHAEAGIVADVLDRVWGGAETLIVVSTDLSHDLDEPAALALDARTARSIEALREEALTPHDACGYAGLRGLLLAARRRGLSASTLELRTSGAVRGGGEPVVGYGAFALDVPAGI